MAQKRYDFYYGQTVKVKAWFYRHQVWTIEKRKEEDQKIVYTVRLHDVKSYNPLLAMMWQTVEVKTLIDIPWHQLDAVKAK